MKKDSEGRLSRRRRTARNEALQAKAKGPEEKVVQDEPKVIPQEHYPRNAPVVQKEVVKEQKQKKGRALRPSLLITLLVLVIILLIVVFLRVYQVPYTVTKVVSFKEPYVVEESFTTIKPFLVNVTVNETIYVPINESSYREESSMEYGCWEEPLQYTIAPLGDLSKKEYNYSSDVGYFEQSPLKTGYYQQQWKFCNEERLRVLHLNLDVCEVYNGNFFDCWRDVDFKVGSSQCEIFGAYKWRTLFQEGKDFVLFINEETAKTVCGNREVVTRVPITIESSRLKVVQRVESRQEMRPVEETRNVTKMRTLQKTQTVIRYQSLWDQFFSGGEADEEGIGN